jgi:putative two-component system response regulator
MNYIEENKAVGRLTEIIALEHGYSPAKARQIKTAAALHDIGKQKIPKSILLKPSELNAQEMEIMKNHTRLGVEMLASFQNDLSDIAKMVCLFHHEWHNPSVGGYWGVSSYYLPDYVSFVSIADVYVSCCSERCYKPAWKPQDALNHIEKQAGTQFRPELVKMFTSLIRNDSRVPAFLAVA